MLYSSTHVFLSPGVYRADRAGQSLATKNNATNPFLTIDKPNPNQRHKYQPRYTPKVRYEPTTKQAPPPKLLQFTLKPWKTPPVQPAPINPPSKKPPAPIKPKLDEITLPGRKDILDALDWEHPTVTLDLGCLSKNVRAVLKDDDQSDSVVQCIRGAVRVASDTKRRCQGVIGRYLEEVFFPRPSAGRPRPKEPIRNVSLQDQSVLDYLCPRLPKDLTTLAKDDDGVEDGSRDDKNVKFLHIFLTYLYSSNPPTQNRSGVGQAVTIFIRRLQELNIIDKQNLPAEAVRNVMDYAPFMVVRSASSQLAAEFKRHYGHGSVQLSNKVQSK